MAKKRSKKAKRKSGKRSAAKRSAPAKKVRRVRRAAARVATPRPAKKRGRKRAKRRASARALTTTTTTTTRRTVRRKNPGGAIRVFGAQALGGLAVRGAFYGLAKIPQLGYGYKFFAAQAVAPIVLAIGAAKMKSPNVAAGIAGAWGFVIADIANSAYQLHKANSTVTSSSSTPTASPTGTQGFVPALAARRGVGSFRPNASNLVGLAR